MSSLRISSDASFKKHFNQSKNIFPLYFRGSVEIMMLDKITGLVNKIDNIEHTNKFTYVKETKKNYLILR